MTPQRQPKKARTGRPGHIAMAARELGVCRSHLWRVIRGQRHSRRLLASYQNWKRANA
jgi:transcriptional regulator of acetoin/glycerol metabolism